MYKNRLSKPPKRQYGTTEDGNVLFIILLAVALIGALTVAVQGTNQQNQHIEDERQILRLTELQRYASQLERGVNFIMQNGHSEVDIRFAHPDADPDYGDLGADADKSDQLFDRLGGGALYTSPPQGINDGSAWEFYGHSALPEVGSNAADLVAVLPNVTNIFCTLINRKIGYTGLPTDPGTCIYGGDAFRFDAGTQFDASPNIPTEASFSIKPSLQGCVECAGDGSRHYFYVLMAR